MAIIVVVMAIAAGITLFALFRAQDGYEDEAGFHTGPLPRGQNVVPIQIRVAATPRPVATSSLSPPEAIGNKGYPPLGGGWASEEWRQPAAAAMPVSHSAAPQG